MQQVFSEPRCSQSSTKQKQKEDKETPFLSVTAGLFWGSTYTPCSVQLPYMGASPTCTGASPADAVAGAFGRSRMSPTGPLCPLTPLQWETSKCHRQDSICSFCTGRRASPGRRDGPMMAPAGDTSFTRPYCWLTHISISWWSLSSR